MRTFCIRIAYDGTRYAGWQRQSNAKSISLSRDAVQEIQTTLDLFIEEVNRGQGSFGATNAAAAQSTRMVGNQN